MDFEITEELEEKFEYLEKYKEDSKKFESLVSDYLKYLGESRQLGKIVRKLALNNKIPIPVIKHIFSSFMTPQMLNLFKKIKYPPFWNDIVEEKFHLQSDFQSFLGNINNKISKKTASQVNDDELKWMTEGYSTPDFKTIENLHQNLLENILPSVKKGVVEIKHVEFKEREAVLKINKQIEVNILSLKKGTSLCRVMFNKAKKNEPMEWSVIHEEITGLELDFNPDKNPPEQRVVRDAMYSINNKIKGVTGSKTGIFRWEEKSVIRLY